MLATHLHRLSSLFVAAVAGGTFALALARAEPGAPVVVSARQFNLVDAAGTTRATFTPDPTGAPAMVLYDARGETRAGISVGPDGTPGLALFDAAGKLRVVLALTPDGTPGLVMLDAAGNVAQRVAP